jgi:hypothetical protein
MTIFQFEEVALKKCKIAIIVGSPGLKEKCGSNEGKGNYWTKWALSQMLESQMIKIPVWFKGNIENNFPLPYHPFPGVSFVDDYFNKVFDLLDGLYQLNPTDTEIKTAQNKFNQALTNDVLYNEYKIKELKQRKRDEEKIRKILGLD